MTDMINHHRRGLLRVSALAGAGVVSSLFAPLADAAAKRTSTVRGRSVRPKITDRIATGDDIKASACEQLMREHGVLDRLLLVYEAALRKFGTSEDFDAAIVSNAAVIMRDFIHNYHEKSEEGAVFPRFQKAGKMLPLVDTLLTQHEAGRRLTQAILRSAPSSGNEDDRKLLVLSMQSFITMYRPHMAREDTDLFPQLRSVVSAHDYDAMADDFEARQHKLFGGDGFEMMVARVADLEAQIGIDDLTQFTPR